MKRSHQRWWLIFAACVVGALATLAWISVLVLDLEREQDRARAERAHATALGDAMWTMDSWFGAHLSREATRPFFEYRAFYAQEQSYTRLLNRIEQGEVLVPSPLLSERFDFIELHFQLEVDGSWSSPTVPIGSQRDLIEANAEAADVYVPWRAKLAELSAAVDPAGLRDALESAEAELEELVGEPRDAYGGRGTGEGKLAQSRAQSTLKEQVAYRKFGKNWSSEAPTIDVGPLVPIWLEVGGEPRLAFVRRVHSSGGAAARSGEVVQGFLCYWRRLSTLLLRHAADVAPGATLEPIAKSEAPSEGRERLATIPAYLDAPPPPVAPRTGMSAARLTLAVSWIAALLALSAVGVTLRASIAYGEKRSRFASAVTHELRTPLTTFRMYSEMLASDMVRDEDTRREYLQTLQEESNRLAHLVENVLTYARLEDERRALRCASVSADEMFARLLPTLRPRCAEAGFDLVSQTEDANGATLVTDVEAVGQILFNLVDNACKYGQSPVGKRVELGAEVHDGRLLIRVRDHGAGIADKYRNTIFGAFDRGDRDPADDQPGVGLGLALARGLARDLGGELVLEHSSGAGACFRLELPVEEQSPGLHAAGSTS
ncbi:MAG: HAMP domain-containing histidine kinase [bacterium]|nr:HAMP domain-containing histidine kinase [bacterium]